MNIYIPSELFESDEYSLLGNCNKLLMVHLYVDYGDCERFTIDLKNYYHYNCSGPQLLSKRIIELMAVGLIHVVTHKKTGNSVHGRLSRVFEFKYKPEL